MRPPVVTQAAIVAALRALGIEDGDDVMFHSSLSSFGHVEGGANSVIDAFLESVGPNGTVLAPSFSRFELRRGEFGSWWNPEATPVYTGEITEAFWRRPVAVRSFHPTHSVAAIGARARYYTSEHGLEGDRCGFWGTGVFSSRSPWEKMVQQEVHYVMAGCSFEPATLGHHVESYLVTADLEGLPQGERAGFANALRHNYYNPEGPWPDIDRVKLGQALDAQGLVRRVRIGWALLERISASEYFRAALDLCRRDPDRWLSKPYMAWRQRVSERTMELRALASDATVSTLLAQTFRRG